jgi:nucleoside-diphosphate-sugar epimerase
MPPFAWGGDAVLSMVHVDALAEGLCLATANAPIGEDYLFCGEPLSIRGLFETHGSRLVQSTDYLRAINALGDSSR